MGLKYGLAEYAPSLTFLVVQKGHNTRFFPTNDKNADRSGNVLPGTVVDSHVVHPAHHDFFLNSHAGIQVRPDPRIFAGDGCTAGWLQGMSSSSGEECVWHLLSHLASGGDHANQLRECSCCVCNSDRLNRTYESMTEVLR